jgi:hypothetical protein
MADLLDIAPSTSVELVTINDLPIPVHGVSIDAIALLASRFPALKSLLNDELNDIAIWRLVQGCSAAVGPIIAAGCGHLSEPTYEQRAATLLPEQQLKFLKVIFGLTFPNEIGFFVKALTSLISPNEGAKAIKVRLRKSPSPLPPSSGADLRPAMQ